MTKPVWCCRPCVSVVAVLILGSLLMACVSNTGTKTAMTSDDIAKLRKAGIRVESPNTLSVRVARDNMTNTGAVLFGLVGAAVEAGYKSSKDSGDAAKVVRVLGNFDAAHESAVALRDKFAAAKVIPEIEILQTANGRALRERGFDALFTQTIEEWGLRSCGGENQVKVELDVHMKLVGVADDSVLWERDELFADGSCRPVSDFQSDGELLRSSLKHAMETLAGKTVNEIAFP